MLTRWSALKKKELKPELKFVVCFFFPLNAEKSLKPARLDEQTFIFSDWGGR